MPLMAGVVSVCIMFGGRTIYPWFFNNVWSGGGGGVGGAGGGGTI